MAAALFMGTSCDDSEGLKVTEQVPNADKTLYEVLLADTELSDFVEVINSCGKHCADSLFNRSRVYTLWAPVNNTFNKDSLIEEAVEKGNREMVFQSFVKAHISNHLRAANGTLDDKNKVAHGFVVLTDEVVFQYKCDEFYAPESEGAIAWDDPDLGIDWKIPSDKIILSEKDRHNPRLKDAQWLFDYNEDLYR